MVRDNLMKQLWHIVWIWGNIYDHFSFDQDRCKGGRVIDALAPRDCRAEVPSLLLLSQLLILCRLNFCFVSTIWNFGS